jgi:hypothetical protein
VSWPLILVLIVAGTAGIPVDYVRWFYKRLAGLRYRRCARD